YSEIIATSVRAPDPWLMIFARWVVRRLGPDAFKVEIQDLDLQHGVEEQLTKKLLEAMGKEIGNIHSPSSGSSNDVLEHLKAMSSNCQSVKWLSNEAMTMAEQIKGDLRDWKKDGHQ